ncbi:hypothetical protein BN2537_2001 [Streptomyces venezuelae]|nr:hypothetical protein BN2537_2001 [Streptomyces venezuelae]
MDRDGAAGTVLRVQPLQTRVMGRGELRQPSRVPGALPGAHRAEDGGEHLLGRIGVEVGDGGVREVERRDRDLRPLHLRPADGRTVVRRGHRRIGGEGVAQGAFGDVRELVGGSTGAVAPAGLVALAAPFRRGPAALADLGVGEGEGTGLHEPDQLLGVPGPDPGPGQELEERRLRVEDARRVQLLPSVVRGVHGLLLTRRGTPAPYRTLAADDHSNTRPGSMPGRPPTRARSRAGTDGSSGRLRGRPACRPPRRTARCARPG